MTLDSPVLSVPVHSSTTKHCMMSPLAIKPVDVSSSSSVESRSSSIKDADARAAIALLLISNFSTASVTIYCDNYFEFWFHGDWIAKDPLFFTPHQAV
jgi:hypothetical protein